MVLLRRLWIEIACRFIVWPNHESWEPITAWLVMYATGVVIAWFVYAMIVRWSVLAALMGATG